MRRPSPPARARPSRRGGTHAHRLPCRYTGYIGGDYSGFLGFLRNAWRNNFVSRLTRVVGLNFVLVTFMLYGVQQGGVHALNELGRVYAYKDRGYEPAETQRAIAWSDMSWNIKPLFGLAFDTLPLFGYHFKPYLLLWGSIGTAAYGLVAAVPNAMSNAVFTLCMWAGMNAVVWNDVAIDGITIQVRLPHARTDSLTHSLTH